MSLPGASGANRFIRPDQELPVPIIMLLSLFISASGGIGKSYSKYSTMNWASCWNFSDVDTHPERVRRRKKVTDIVFIEL